jgi:polysaccharide export outer membrane protein
MTSRLLCYALALMAASLGAVATGCAPGSVKPVAAGERSAGTQEYRIGPADVLQISVWKNEALTRTVPVRPDGMISLPLVNEIRAAGLTPIELRDLLKKKLTEYVPSPEVSVIVMEMHSYMVSVLGEVKTAGRYQFMSPVTVLDVLARAGGITEFATPSRLYVLRPEKGVMKKIPFNYNKVVAAPGKHQNFFVQPGDIIVVP